MDIIPLGDDLLLGTDRRTDWQRKILI